MLKFLKYFIVIISIMAILPSLSSATVPQYTKPISLLQSNDVTYIPSGKGYGIPVKKQKGFQISPNLNIPQNGIFYHGGPVMGTTSSTIPNVYLIWYGNWSGNSATTIIPNFLRGIGATSWYNIEATYTDGSGRFILHQVNLMTNPGVFDNYSQGTSFDGSRIYNIVQRAITNGSLPNDSNGIYLVLTSQDVYITNFCSSFCGWHTANYVNGVPIQYAFIGNAISRCPGGCITRSSTGNTVNNNPGADGMVSIIAHELVETISDPWINAWFDNAGAENADKCSWRYGSTQTSCNGSPFNITVNGMNYLIQQNWVNLNGGFCASSV